jgi:hypothetical protein
MTTPAEVAAAGQLACLLEVSAPKPGNVSPDRHFHDTRYEDFLASAVAIGPALAQAHVQPLGATIRRAVEDTLRWTRSNTNLGIVLLLAPLARAALIGRGSTRVQFVRCVVNRSGSAKLAPPRRHGLRAGEACRLKWDAIMFDRRIIYINRLKGSLSGNHPLQSDEVEALKVLR